MKLIDIKTADGVSVAELDGECFYADTDGFGRRMVFRAAVNVIAWDNGVWRLGPSRRADDLPHKVVDVYSTRKAAHKALAEQYEALARHHRELAGEK